MKLTVVNEEDNSCISSSWLVIANVDSWGIGSGNLNTDWRSCYYYLGESIYTCFLDKQLEV